MSARSHISTFVQDLARRHVIRVAGVYLVVAWVIVQVSSEIFPPLGLPDWTITFVLVCLGLGLPMALVLAWAFDLTPEGIRRTPGGAVASAAAVAAPVEAVAVEPTAPVAADRSSIAVLPFMNMSADAETDYFSDGMTEELINELTHVDGLRVAARTSSFAFKGRNLDVREIGHQLSVGTVLEGSVRRYNDRLRVTAQLIDVADGYHLWSETFDRELADVFAIQEEIARSIVATLRVTLSPDEARRMLERPTRSLEAYNHYLQARYCWNQRTDSSLKSSADFFKSAIAADGDYALAHAGLADTYALLGIAEYGIMPPREVMPRARAAAERALEIDPSLAEAQTCLAHVQAFFDWDWQGAEASFRRAIELDPEYAFAYHWYALFLAAMERHDEAVEAELRAREIEPLALIINKNVGTILFYASRREEAFEEYRKALRLEPNFSRTHLYLGLAFASIEDYARAAEEFQRSIELTGRNTVVLAALGHAYARTGQVEKARRVLAELSERAAQEYVPAMSRVLVHLGLRDIDGCFDWLDRAVEERSSWLVSLRVDPLFDDLRTDPRFHSILERVGLPV